VRLKLGWDRTPSLPGSRGATQRLLHGGSTLASRMPVALLVAVLLLTGGAAYAATDVGLSADQELFMGDNPPEVTENLPESIQPGEYSLKSDRADIYADFQPPYRQGFILVTGDVATPGRARRGRRRKRRRSTTRMRSTSRRPTSRRSSLRCRRCGRSPGRTSRSMRPSSGRIRPTTDSEPECRGSVRCVLPGRRGPGEPRPRPE